MKRAIKKGAAVIIWLIVLPFRLIDWALELGLGPA